MQLDQLRWEREELVEQNRRLQEERPEQATIMDTETKALRRLRHECNEAKSQLQEANALVEDLQRQQDEAKAKLQELEDHVSQESERVRMLQEDIESVARDAEFS